MTWFFCLCLIMLLTDAAIAKYSVESLQYLEQFSYLPKVSGGPSAILSESVVEVALKKLQKYGRIPVTGKLDSETIKLMARKSVDNYPLRYVRDISVVRREVWEAISEWENVSSLSFQEVEPRADPDIRISFKTGDHHDGYPFDGTGRVLAHAFSPGVDIGGDVHLDNDEAWTDDLVGDPRSNAVSLRSVILHELGHSLGLPHSDDDNSIMYAFYQHKRPPRLGASDARSIQILYGLKKSPSKNPKSSTALATTATTQSPRQRTTTTPQWNYRDRTSTKEPQLPDVCTMNIDAITHVRGEIFVFKDEWLWRFWKTGELQAKGRRISSYWKDLPGRIDAAVEDGRYLMFFSGDKCYTYDGQNLLSIKSLTDIGFPPYVQKIRLAYSWNYWPDKPIYFWTDKEFWKLDRKSGEVEKGYPRKISAAWHNIPDEATAAATLNDELFFFTPSKAMKFYSINMSAGAPFPLSRLLPNCPQFYTISSAVRRSQAFYLIYAFVVMLFLDIFCVSSSCVL